MKKLTSLTLSIILLNSLNSYAMESKLTPFNDDRTVMLEDGPIDPLERYGSSPESSFPPLNKEDEDCHHISFSANLGDLGKLDVRIEEKGSSKGKKRGASFSFHFEPLPPPSPILPAKVQGENEEFGPLRRTWSEEGLADGTNPHDPFLPSLLLNELKPFSCLSPSRYQKDLDIFVQNFFDLPSQAENLSKEIFQLAENFFNRSPKEAEYFFERKLDNLYHQRLFTLEEMCFWGIYMRKLPEKEFLVHSNSLKHPLLNGIITQALSRPAVNFFLDQTPLEGLCLFFSLLFAKKEISSLMDSLPYYVEFYETQKKLKEKVEQSLDPFIFKEIDPLIKITNCNTLINFNDCVQKDTPLSREILAYLKHYGDYHVIFPFTRL